MCCLGGCEGQADMGAEGRDAETTGQCAEGEAGELHTHSGDQ